eukprot:Polyplicarium_translucidae@DN4128_c0_g1_i1.p2
MKDDDKVAALVALGAETKSIEAEMEAQVAFLTAPGMPGVSGPLVDAEGFPRSDVDVHAVRTARHRLACLKTDLHSKLEETKAALEKLHSV